MDDLFASSASPESVLSGRFRVHPVVGDSWEPALKGGRDYVIAAPVTAYQGEGVYLIDSGFCIELFRVTNTLESSGVLYLSRENPRYQATCVERSIFNERVVGIVVAEIRTRDERFLANA